MKTKINIKNKKKAYAKKIRRQLLKSFLAEKENAISMIAGKYRIQRADAEDVFSKAFIKAYRNAPFFKGQSSIKTWMFRIVHNTFLDSNRKLSNKLEKPISSFSFQDDEQENSFIDSALLKYSGQSANPSLIFEKADENSKMAANILAVKQKLSETHRKVLEAVFEKSLSYEDVAKEMKCSIGTIMSRVFYARRSFIKNYNIILDKENCVA